MKVKKEPKKTCSRNKLASIQVSIGGARHPLTCPCMFFFSYFLDKNKVGWTTHSMTAHDLPYVLWLLSPLSKNPTMQFLCTLKSHYLSQRQKPTKNKVWIQHWRPPALRSDTHYSKNQSSRIHIIGWGVVVQRARGWGGWGFCLGFVLDAWRTPVRRWPSLSCSRQCTSHGQTVRRSLVGCCSLSLVHIHCCWCVIPFLMFI